MIAPRPIFFDTNLFLRQILADHPHQSPRCRALFLEIEAGRVAAWTSPLAIAEIVWVLSGRYGFTRSQIRAALLPLIKLPGLRIENKAMFDRAFELYAAARIDYIDCYHAALLEARGETALYSYDTDFDRVPSLRRQEP